MFLAKNYNNMFEFVKVMYNLGHCCSLFSETQRSYCKIVNCPPVRPIACIGDLIRLAVGIYNYGRPLYSVATITFCGEFLFFSFFSCYCYVLL